MLNKGKALTAAVIGAGPAGCAASVQLSRAGFNVLLFEREHIGGLVVNAGLVENYPGFPKGISGPALSKRLGNHVRQHNTINLLSEANRIRIKNGFRIESAGNIYHADRLVLATGTLPIIPERLHSSKRILTGISKIRNKRNRSIAVIGAGDAAFDYALTLSRYNRVYILNRSAREKCLALLKDRIINTTIVYYKNTIVDKILEKGSSLCIDLKNKDTCFNLDVDFLVCATGRKADDRLVKDCPGLANHLYARMVGDLVNGKYRQAAIAAGQGLRAAMELAEL